MLQTFLGRELQLTYHLLVMLQLECQAVSIDNVITECIPKSYPEILDKCARMKFENEKGEEEWYEGVVSLYSVITGKFSIYFPSDGQTEEAFF